MQAGEAAPGHSFDEALRGRAADFVVEQKFDLDQTFRYAEPAGDPMPIHLDDEFAKKMGLPGIIMHGLCTMAFTSHAVLSQVAPGQPRTVEAARGAVRHARPARAGHDHLDLARGQRSPALRKRQRRGPSPDQGRPRRDSKGTEP